MHKFLCGCQVPSRERLQGDPELTSLDTVAFDTEGFLVCKPHHQRISGWRVPAHAPLMLGMAGATDLEWQTWVLYGVKPKKETLDSITLTSNLARFSMKDNRDPVADFDKIMTDVELDRIAHSDPLNTNGHGYTHVAMQEGKPIMYGGEAKPTVIIRNDGNAQMRYQRELAQAQVISKSSTELHKRETGF